MKVRLLLSDHSSSSLLSLLRYSFCSLILPNYPKHLIMRIKGNVQSLCAFNFLKHSIASSYCFNSSSAFPFS